eukprot:2142220-Rhodomonas_salina.1
MEIVGIGAETTCTVIESEFVLDPLVTDTENSYKTAGAKVCAGRDSTAALLNESSWPEPWSLQVYVTLLIV